MAETARVLVVDDAEAIRASVEASLIAAGHQVLALADGRDLAAHLAQFRPDVVVLDVGLPGPDGFSLLDLVRRSSGAGVVMLTARDAVADRLRGLDSGADDYVVKPFLLPELVSRINALLRRTGRVSRELVVADLVVDLDAGLARRGSAVLPLTATEFRLLRYFAENARRVVSKAQILTAVWGFEASDPNLVEVHLSSLRRKMEEHGPRLLQTARGLGYVLRAEP